MINLPAELGWISKNLPLGPRASGCALGPRALGQVFTDPPSLCWQVYPNPSVKNFRADEMTKRSLLLHWQLIHDRRKSRPESENILKYRLFINIAFLSITGKSKFMMVRKQFILGLKNQMVDPFVF
jgi:hypothetical protein